MSDDRAVNPQVAPPTTRRDNPLQEAATNALAPSPTALEKQQRSLMWHLATRRDALLLLLLVSATLAWTWERGALAALAGCLVSAFVFWLMLRLIQQSLIIEGKKWNKKVRQTGDSEAELVRQWLNWLLLAVGLATSLMMARAAWLGLGMGYLTVTLALLTGSWQIWLYLWVNSLIADSQGEDDK